MKELELRLAFVFYGGVSLAIYMHGVSREVLNLVRASASRAARNGRIYVAPSLDRPESPSEKTYRDILDRIAGTVDIRVVSDAIAGASAGGVNGIMLARALAHDLPLDGHRDLWLKNADVTELARPQNGLSRYFKSGVSPVLDRLVSRQLKSRIVDSETRDKLRTFMQSRWFKPPFSGSRYIGWMLEACAEMDRHMEDGKTLIPRGQTLDLFVTLTDYYGQRRRIRIDDPAFIEEVDHRRVLNFHAMHRMPGDLVSQFGSDSIPELVFAARATSSFPGAFVPATVSEMDHVLKKAGLAWPNRSAFLAKGLELDPEHPGNRCFVDGSVVMNKPFGPVIDVIKQRPASREVARRLIYVDPLPGGGETAEENGPQMPSFFHTILASLAHIPRNEPIGNELRDIEARNRRGHWLAETIAAADPVVDKAVRKILRGRTRINADALTTYRTLANADAHAQAGYAFLNYQSLKLHAICERLSDLIAAMAGPTGRDARRDMLLWLIGSHFAELAKASGEGPPDPDTEVVGLLRSLDVDYRVRRLRFAIRKLNGLYPRVREIDDDGQAIAGLDRLKSRLYQQIDNLRWRWREDFYGEDSRTLAENLCRTLSQPSEDKPEKTALLRGLLDHLAQLMGLKDLDRMQDEVFAEFSQDPLLSQTVGHELTGRYVGFAFYDLVTFPLLRSNDFSEVSEILVDRVSPRDAGSFGAEGFELKGENLNAFGAFFNRRWREHDYLWGRLNAADRLISIVLSAAGTHILTPPEEKACRYAVFTAILDEEEPVLTADPGLVPPIREQIAAFAGETADFCI